MSLKRNNKGFTFVELLIAVFILAVAIGGVLLLYVTSMISSQLAWDMTVATSHAEYVLEEAQRSDSIGSILVMNWEEWAVDQGLNTLPGETIDIIFSEPSSNLLDMQVTVNWTRKLRSHGVTFITKVAK
ncbi:MAG: prepilin-type N-terminal cleavage/methylation domain-containing protein [Candidatus Omnitrophica bacterium]|nr:prepilin-type N-terminal cleavage/methylation domain-containing protein [Candidatus Omnitrophota bacterium]